MSCSEAAAVRCRMVYIASILSILVLATFANLAAQSTVTSTALSVNGDNMTPTPGGHDYIHFFGETVSPSNGSVSYRLNYPMPKGRGLSYPYWYGYNSAGLYQLMYLSPEQTLNWVPNPLNFNGSGPYVTYSESQIPTVKYQCGPQPSNQCQLWPCNYATGFTFAGLDGVSHNTGLLAVGPSQGPPPPTWTGGANPCGSGWVVAGGDGEISAQFTDTSGTIGDLEGWSTACGQCIPAVSGPVGSYTITDKDGTTYFFGDGVYNSAAQVYVATPTKIEDRNGNVISGTLDTLQRQISSGSFPPVIGGIQYPAATAPPGAPGSNSVVVNYNVQHDKVYSNSYNESIICPWITGDFVGNISGSQAAWTALALPDGTQYTFFYGTYNPTDSTVSNNFGLLNEVEFPGGGYIKYKWNIETNTNNATSMAEYSGTGGQTGLIRNGACFLRYSVPTLTSRIVSYDGKTVAQTQTFTYITTWPTNWVNNVGDWLSKQTTVTTQDNVLGKTSKIVYNYVPGIQPGTGNAIGGGSAAQIPLESSILYYDWGSSSPLKTVHKAWFNPFEEACELTTINGMTSGHFYQYLNSASPYIDDYATDDQEFDYGAISDPTVCGRQFTAGVSPTRETKTTYQSFQAPTVFVPDSGNTYQPGAFFQKPKTVVTYDGAGNRLAETDYAYDGGTLTDPGTVVAHDESNYSISATVRGNVTAITRQCFTSNCTGSNPNPQTTYAYDKAGQVVSKTAPCGNISGGCSDIGNVGQTTTYSYIDSTPGNAAGPSDAYVSKITYPPTGSATHQVSFSYNYALGDLTSSTDQNGQTTTYTYECSSEPCSALDRLTKSAFPDGGQTTLTYNDWTSVTTSQLIAASKTAKSSTAVMDGMFRPVQTQLTSDPEGTDYTDTTLDAEGRTIAVSNPHRTGGSTTDGNTQTIADVLGRPLKITKQDGSIVTTLYDDPCFIVANSYGVTVTDEAGNHRRSCTDGLGRLVEVDEPGAGNGPLVPGTATVYLNGGTQNPVTINPCANNPPPQNNCPQTIYNNGTTTVTVNGVMVSESWSGSPGFTMQDFVTEMVNGLNGTGIVSAVASGNSVVVTALQGGNNSNYSISTSTTWNTQYFSSASYSASLSGGSLTGGSGYAFYSTNAFITLYNYDLLGNLLCVWQRGSDTTTPPAFSYSVSSNTSNCLTAVPATWRPRSFTYDSLARLVTSSNPESGTISYTYDVNGNLTSKTAPQPNQLSTATETTNYAYDALNRLLSKSYTGMSSPVTAAATYGYDGIAATGCTPPSLGDLYPKPLRTSMCDGAGASSWAHDKMGRIATEKRTTAGVTMSTTYTYNLDGSVASVVYPSGHTLNYDYFGSNSVSAGRLINLTDSGGTSYVTAAKYAPPGEAVSYYNNSTSGITNTNVFGPRLQPWYLSSQNPSGTAIMQLCYDFHSAQAVSTGPCSFAASSAGDNGNIYRVANQRTTGRSQNFTYDSLNRIQQAWTDANSPATYSWGETFTTDAWGNLTNKGPVGGKTQYEALNAAPANNKNQLNGYCHDSSGNLILNAGCPTGSFVATYSYDAENRMVANPGATYVYDGDGNRVKKVGSTTTLYWYGATGDILTETDSSGGTVNDYVLFNGKRVARRDATTVRYYFSDHLGSTSLITDANGTMAPEAESDYYPYGGEMVITADSSNNHYKFTGKERDAETCGTMCLDNFGARYSTASLGRFMTPDWDAKATAVPYAKFGDPQTLNLYAFVENAPINKVDADGHCPLGDGADNSAACPQLRPDDKAAVEAAVDRTKKPTADDKKGNNHEEAVVAGKDKDGNHAIVPAKPGAYSDVTKKGAQAEVNPSVAADPSKQQTITNPEVVAHVHPAGTATSLSIGADGQTTLKTDFWRQPPSPGDIQAAIPAPGVNLVVGAGTTGNASGSPTVYFFNSSGTTCTESYDAFKKSGN